MSNQGWDDILDADETIIWQGRPEPGIRIQPKNIIQMVFGVFFAGFALVWMVMASQAGGGFWMFGLIHFSVGLGIGLWPIFGPSFQAKRTWYTLTNRRGIIASTTITGQKRLKSYPITDSTSIEQITNNDGTGSINFASETRRGQKGRSYTVAIGFENIADAGAVQRQIRDIQKGST